MTAAAERTEYERAAALRDKIRAIERTMESQKMAAFAKTELDLVGLARQDNQAAIQLFVIRDGKMIGRDVFLLDAAREATDDEVLTSFLEQYYARAGSIPREVYVPAAIAEAAVLEAFLAERRGGPVHLRVPQRGEKRELLALATRNAGETLAREQARWLADQGKTLAALEELAEALGLPGPPLRIECYDISNFQGSESVGSMVVFEDGKPRSGEYRRFRIKTVQRPERLRQPPGGAAPPVPVGRGPARRAVEEARRWAMPDLVIVDGGKGQVSAAKEVLDELGLHDLPLAGLAKEREELFLPGPDRPDRPAGDLAGALPRPAPARRGAPLRDHLSPRPARASGAFAPRSTTCPASARSASASCSRCSGRSSASATRRSSRSRPCRASARRWRRGSRRRSRPDGPGRLARHVASSSSFRCTGSLSCDRISSLEIGPPWAAPPEGTRPHASRRHRTSSRPAARARIRRGIRPLGRSDPVPCNIPPRCVKPARSSSCSSGSSPSSSTSCPGSSSPTRQAPTAPGGRSRRSSASTWRAACASNTRRCPSRARRRRPRTWRSSRTSSSAA